MTNLPPILFVPRHGHTRATGTVRAVQNLARALRGTVDVSVQRYSKHGGFTMLWNIGKIADWFDQYLHGPMNLARSERKQTDMDMGRSLDASSARGSTERLWNSSQLRKIPPVQLKGNPITH